MAILKAKRVAKMEPKARKEKLKELKLELIKSNVSANKANAKNKEIKKAIARLITYEKISKLKIKNEEKKDIKITKSISEKVIKNQ